MNILDSNNDILGKIEEEVKTIRKYKNNYDNFVNIFKSQIEYTKYDILSDELEGPTFGPVESRTKEGVLNITDKYEITDLEDWPPL